jgi:cbb3-type cytochrome oxidase maturation protein
MDILVILFPLALGLGLAGLAAFCWCMRSGQFVDLEGAGWRVLSDEDLPANPVPDPRETR